MIIMPQVSTSDSTLTEGRLVLLRTGYSITSRSSRRWYAHGYRSHQKETQRRLLVGLYLTYMYPTIPYTL